LPLKTSFSLKVLPQHQPLNILWLLEVLVGQYEVVLGRVVLERQRGFLFLLGQQLRLRLGVAVVVAMVVIQFFTASHL
jgi:hypothetical protein